MEVYEGKDEKALKTQLDQSSDFEERRKIRAAIRDLRNKRFRTITVYETPTSPATSCTFSMPVQQQKTDPIHMPGFQSKQQPQTMTQNGSSVAVLQAPVGEKVKMVRKAQSFKTSSEITNVDTGSESPKIDNKSAARNFLSSTLPFVNFDNPIFKVPGSIPMGRSQSVKLLASKFEPVSKSDSITSLNQDGSPNLRKKILGSSDGLHHHGNNDVDHVRNSSNSNTSSSNRDLSSSDGMYLIKNRNRNELNGHSLVNENKLKSSSTTVETEHYVPSVRIGRTHSLKLPSYRDNSPSSERMNLATPAPSIGSLAHSYGTTSLRVLSGSDSDLSGRFSAKDNTDICKDVLIENRKIRPFIRQREVRAASSPVYSQVTAAIEIHAHGQENVNKHPEDNLQHTKFRATSSPVPGDENRPSFDVKDKDDVSGSNKWNQNIGSITPVLRQTKQNTELTLSEVKDMHHRAKHSLRNSAPLYIKCNDEDTKVSSKSIVLEANEIVTLVSPTIKRSSSLKNPVIQSVMIESKDQIRRANSLRHSTTPSRDLCDDGVRFKSIHGKFPSTERIETVLNVDTPNNHIVCSSISGGSELAKQNRVNKSSHVAISLRKSEPCEDENNPVLSNNTKNDVNTAHDGPANSNDCTIKSNEEDALLTSNEYTKSSVELSSERVQDNFTRSNHQLSLDSNVNSMDESSLGQFNSAQQTLENEVNDKEKQHEEVYQSFVRRKSSRLSVDNPYEAIHDEKELNALLKAASDLDERINIRAALHKLKQNTLANKSPSNNMSSSGQKHTTKLAQNKAAIQSLIDSTALSVETSRSESQIDDNQFVDSVNGSVNTDISMVQGTETGDKNSVTEHTTMEDIGEVFSDNNGNCDNKQHSAIISTMSSKNQANDTTQYNSIQTEDQLQNLLNQTTDYFERKKIRTALTTLKRKHSLAEVEKLKDKGKHSLKSRSSITLSNSEDNTNYQIHNYDHNGILDTGQPFTGGGSNKRASSIQNLKTRDYNDSKTHTNLKTNHLEEDKSVIKTDYHLDKVVNKDNNYRTTESSHYKSYYDNQNIQHNSNLAHNHDSASLNGSNNVILSQNDNYQCIEKVKDVSSRPPTSVMSDLGHKDQNTTGTVFETCNDEGITVNDIIQTDRFTQQHMHVLSHNNTVQSKQPVISGLLPENKQNYTDRYNDGYCNIYTEGDGINDSKQTAVSYNEFNHEIRSKKDDVLEHEFQFEKEDKTYDSVNNTCDNVNKQRSSSDSLVLDRVSKDTDVESGQLLDSKNNIENTKPGLRPISHSRKVRLSRGRVLSDSAKSSGSRPTRIKRKLPEIPPASFSNGSHSNNGDVESNTIMNSDIKLDNHSNGSNYKESNVDKDMEKMNAEQNGDVMITSNHKTDYTSHKTEEDNVSKYVLHRDDIDKAGQHFKQPQEKQIPCNLDSKSNSSDQYNNSEKQVSDNIDKISIVTSGAPPPITDFNSLESSYCSSGFKSGNVSVFQNNNNNMDISASSGVVISLQEDISPKTSPILKHKDEDNMGTRRSLKTLDELRDELDELEKQLSNSGDFEKRKKLRGDIRQIRTLIRDGNFVLKTPRYDQPADTIPSARIEKVTSLSNSKTGAKQNSHVTQGMKMGSTVSINSTDDDKVQNGSTKVKDALNNNQKNKMSSAKRTSYKTNSQDNLDNAFISQKVDLVKLSDSDKNVTNSDGDEYIIVDIVDGDVVEKHDTGKHPLNNNYTTPSHHQNVDLNKTTRNVLDLDDGFVDLESPRIEQSDSVQGKSGDTFLSNNIEVSSQQKVEVVMVGSEENEDDDIPEVTLPLSDMIAIDGEDTCLSCKISAPSKAEITWYKETRVIMNTPEFIQRRENDLMTLHIHEVFPDDEGEYRCVVKANGGEAETSCYLLVKENKLAVLPSFISSLKDQTVEDGGRVILKCQVAGRPTPRIYWYHGVELLKHHLEIRQEVLGEWAMLTIPKVFCEDAGTYECAAKNVAGETRCSASLTVTEKTPSVEEEPEQSPELVMAVDYLDLDEGDSLTLSCQVTGLPTPQIVWKKDNKTINLSNGYHIDFSEGQASVVVYKVCLTHDGVFECTAQNDAGSASVTCLVNVKAKSHTTSTSLKRSSSLQPLQHPDNNGFSSPYSKSSQRLSDGHSIERFSNGLYSNSINSHSIDSESPITRTDRRVIDIYKSSDSLKRTNSLPIKQRVVNATADNRAKSQLYKSDSLNLHESIADNKSKAIDPPRILQFLPECEEITLEKPFCLECRFNFLSYNAIVAWFKDGIELPKAGRIKWSVDNAITKLWINRASKGDVGNYRVVVKNAAGEVRSRCQVKLKQAPITVVPPSSSLTSMPGVRGKLQPRQVNEKANNLLNSVLGHMITSKPSSSNELHNNVSSTEGGLGYRRHEDHTKHLVNIIKNNNREHGSISSKVLPDNHRVIIHHNQTPEAEEPEPFTNQYSSLQTLHENIELKMSSQKIEEMEDEEALHKMMNNTDNFDERKKIRARLREIREQKAEEYEQRRRERENNREDAIKMKIRQAEQDKQRKMKQFDEMAKAPKKQSSAMEDSIREKHAAADAEKQKKLEQYKEMATVQSKSYHSGSEQIMLEQRQKADAEKERKMQEFNEDAVSRSTKTENVPGGTLTTTTTKTTHTTKDGSTMVTKESKQITQTAGIGGTSYVIKKTSADMAAQNLYDTFSNKGLEGTNGMLVVKTEEWSSKDGITKRNEKTKTWGGKKEAPQSAMASFKKMDGANPKPKDDKVGVQRSPSTVKEVMLAWSKKQVEGYPNVNVNNFSSSWNDGMAFCALIHHFHPETFDFKKLDPKRRRANFTLAFNVAEKVADIAPLLDVDDMVKMKNPDWKCVFTYVQSFYRKFRDS